MYINRNLCRIACGVSGGVDSSVAALLLKKKGYDVVGAFMRNWDGKDETGVCAADKDAEDAERTCKLIGIPFLEVNFVKEYWNLVFENLIDEYQKGITPNPDILCNYRIKFDLFFTHAQEKLGADYIATGHYARTSIGENFDLVNSSTGVQLLQAEDSSKDQTFFLSHIQQSSLSRSVFPLGDLLKTDVRQIASEAGLDHVASRPDSTGICFIGKRRFQNFIDQYITKNPGPFIDVDTREEVGRHEGIHMWTLGQRCRLGGFRKPYFIASKDPETQTIFVASGTEHPALYSDSFNTGHPHWIHSIPTELSRNNSFDCWFRFQHTKPLVRVRIELHPLGMKVTLQEPIRALTPGQYAVFYLDKECLGCARILQSSNQMTDLARYVTQFNHG